MPPITDRLKKLGATLPETPKGPVWQGPSAKGPNGGITFSALSRFLVCRERFRITMIEGLKPEQTFQHRIEFGQCWHVCEEAFAAGTPTRRWEIDLKEYCAGLCRKYPMQQEQIVHWMDVVKVTFPQYIDYWKKQKDVVQRTPILQERTFDVPYDLPSGRTVRLRGKWDAVDLIGKGKSAGVYLFETKTKGDVNEGQIKTQLSRDLQTMMYISALTQDTGIDELEEVKQKVGVGKSPSEKSRSAIKGLRFNVIRRPLSGGKGSIVRRKGSKNVPAETREEYYGRLAEYIREEPETYFFRWKTEISQGDVVKFRRQCLNPILEQLCDWYEFISAMKGLDTGPGNQFYPFTEFENGTLGHETHGRKIKPWVHWIHPFGVRNVLDEGGSSDLDAYLESGSTIGLQRVDTLFSELQ